MTSNIYIFQFVDKIYTVDDPVDKGLGLGSNPAAKKKKKSLFLDASTPSASDTSGTDEEEDDDEDAGEGDDTDERHALHNEDKKEEPRGGQQLATQFKSFFTEMMTTFSWNNWLK